MPNVNSPTIDFNTVEVRGTYIGLDGSAITGNVTFTARAARAVDVAALVMIVLRPITATISAADGTISVLLPATDDPDINVTFTYQVVENFKGGETYDITVPVAAATTGIDLATTDRTYPVTASPDQFLVTQTTFDALATRVTTLENTSGSGTYIPLTQKGAPSGVATLDVNGHILDGASHLAVISTTITAVEKLTQAAYDALAVKDPTTLYITS